MKQNSNTMQAPMESPKNDKIQDVQTLLSNSILAVDEGCDGPEYLLVFGISEDQLAEKHTAAEDEEETLKKFLLSKGIPFKVIDIRHPDIYLHY